MTALRLTFAALLAPLLAATATPAFSRSDTPLPFFAFDNGVGQNQWSPEKQAAVLKELGYDGIGYHDADDLPEKIAVFKACGMKVYNFYVGINLDRDKTCPPALKRRIAQLKGSGTDVWLFVSGKKENDQAKAVKLIREIGGLAEASGIRVAIYPHYGNYIATIDEALPVVAAVNRKNVGLTFNLCHELRAGNEAEFDRIIKEAMPHLFYVSINGADHKGDWKQLIQTLDRGAFDTGAFLKKLSRAGYKGPVGLQCYAIGGDPRENLKRSMAAWRSLTGAARD